MKADYLIIGSGIAGLTIAIKLAEQFPARKIIVVTKSSKEESNTQYAQGGIAVVMDEINDHFEKHIEDTLICGDGLCDREVVEIVVTEGPKRLQELIDWGTQFDRTATGTLDWQKKADIPIIGWCITKTKPEKKSSVLFWQKHSKIKISNFWIIILRLICLLRIIVVREL